MQQQSQQRRAGRAAAWVKAALLAAALLILSAMGYLAVSLLASSNSSIIHIAKGRNMPMARVRLVAKALDPELMRYAIPDTAMLEDNYKNPCWMDDTQQLRCLPYVYLLGSFQSGASTMFQKLAEHPDVITNDASRWQFWAEDVKRMEDYVSKHSQRSWQLQEAPDKKIILDGSASTFAFYWSAGLRAHRVFQSVMLPCRRQCSEMHQGKPAALRECTSRKCYPRAMAADMKVAESLHVPYDTLHLPLIMRAAYGTGFTPKLIVLLRNPIDRLYCAYWAYPHYHNKYGKTAQGFAAYVKEQVGALKACAKRMTGQIGGAGQPMTEAAAERHCAMYFEALGPQEEQLYFHADQLLRGLYAIWLEHWLHFFPRENLLVLRAESYFEDNAATLAQVMAFLGLATPADSEDLQQMQTAGKPQPCTKGAPAMPLETRQTLLDLYRPYNEQLTSLLEDDWWLSYNANGTSI